MYVGGSFSSLGGLPRHHLGAVSLSNVVNNWPPEPNGSVNAMVASGSAVWVGGAFTEIAGMPQTHLARLVPVNTVDVPGPVAGRSSTVALELGPNPTRGALHVRYAVPVAGRVRIAVYDVMGRRVGPAVEQQVQPGEHDLTWHDGAPGGAPAAGLYFVRLDVGGTRLTRRFAIVR